jgi:hypothetical protein
LAYIVDENGNYKRTVRCSYCYESGHNKGGCEKRKTEYKEYIIKATTELESGKYVEEWERKSVERRVKSYQHELEKLNSKGKNRSCSHCHETGHNRAGCQSRKTMGLEMAQRAIITRQQVRTNLLAQGYGVGALVTWTDENGSDDGSPAVMLGMVESVDFSKLRPDFCDDVKPGKVNTFYPPQMIAVKLITEKFNWGKRVERTYCSPPAEALVLEGGATASEIKDRMRQSNRASVSAVSPVSLNSYDTKAFSMKLVIKQCYKNYIDED